MKNIIKMVFAVVVLAASGMALADPTNPGGPFKPCPTCRK
jgi:hypothetical protein